MIHSEKLNLVGLDKDGVRVLVVVMRLKKVEKEGKLMEELKELGKGWVEKMGDGRIRMMLVNPLEKALMEVVREVNPAYLEWVNVDNDSLFSDDSLIRSLLEMDYADFRPFNEKVRQALRKRDGLETVPGVVSKLKKTLAMLGSPSTDLSPCTHALVIVPEELSDPNDLTYKGSSVSEEMKLIFSLGIRNGIKMIRVPLTLNN
jgi:hypothetical protein